MTRRVASFELIRIIAMILIVGAHATQWGFFYRGSVQFTSDNLFNSLAFPLVRVFCSNFAVNLFILISSWFMVSEKAIRLDRVVKTWLTTVFYTFGTALVFFFAGSIALRETIEYLTPIYHNTYWFMTKYMGFLLITPFLVKLCHSLKKKDFHIMFCALGLLCITIVRNIPYGNIFISESSSLIVWSFLFSIAYYLRTYGFPEYLEKHKLKALLALIAIQWIGGICINLLQDPQSIAGDFSGEYNGITFFTSILFFCWVKDWNLGEGKMANCISDFAKYSFGVYLFHEHPLIRRWLWEDVFNMTDAFHTPLYIPTLLIVCMIIYMAGSTIDYAREMAFRLIRLDKLFAKLKIHSLLLSD